MNIEIHDQLSSALSNRFRCLAAKLNKGKSEWLPLWVHSMDTCGIAERLLCRWLPERARQAMNGGMTEEQLLFAVRAAAILHDLGKTSIAFQTLIASECPVLQEHLAEKGLSLLNLSNMNNLRSYQFHHTACGEVLLLMKSAPLTFAEIIGAHHGQPWPDGRKLKEELAGSATWRDIRSMALWGESSQRDGWRETQEETLLWMLGQIGCKQVSELPEIPETTAVLLTGLVIMADWIASNEAFFPLIPLDAEVPENLSIRAEQGWRSLNLPPAWIPGEADDWEQNSQTHFGFAPNKVQMAMLQAVRESKEPGLIILEAPMGLGKTEAALMTANLLAQNEGTGGIFFGLPTQATANAIFNRIVDWGEKLIVKNQVSIRLAHGMSEMNSEYISLMAGNNVSTVEEDADAENLIVHEWFRGRKQALLADFVVGTVDQVLMAALRQKHVMLRHLGLCGKTVIIDECHAYDAYMNQYLEEALRWLGSYHTPVVMLSATLPAEQRANFMAAYLNKSSRASRRLREEAWYSSRAYPVLTWTNGTEVKQEALPYDQTGRTVLISRIVHEDSVESQIDAVISILKESLRDGGCAAVILNTVGRAQTFSQVIQEAMPDCKILLLHSRFVMPDRLEHERELLERMGKRSAAHDRNRVIVVGTQVIEQSLDFDADVMISDLCPMDLLLQRIGRLHRHSQHDSIRPDLLQQPRCHVLAAGDAIEYGAKMIYGAYLLMRTRDLLPEKIQLPGDISRLVNDVYDSSFPLPVIPEGYEAARMADETRRAEMQQNARAFRIHDPGNDYSELLTGDIRSDEEHARAQVRAGVQTMDVLLLTRNVSGEYALLPWLGQGEAWRAEESPSSEEARKLLAQRISLPAALYQKLERELSSAGLQQALAPPAGWEQSPWLRNSHLLILDDEMTAKLGSVILMYSKERGLEWKKEESE